MSVPVDQLRSVPLFAGMTDRAFESIAGLAEERVLDAGSQLAVEGEPGEAFYLILDGGVTITRGGTAVVELGPGDFLGEIALVDGRPRTATATALTDVRALALECAAFAQLMERFPAVRHGILVALTDRVRADEMSATD
jgi:CRP-like cAMP-binding protein